MITDVPIQRRSAGYCDHLLLYKQVAMNRSVGVYPWLHLYVMLNIAGANCLSNWYTLPFMGGDGLAHPGAEESDHINFRNDRVPSHIIIIFLSHGQCMHAGLCIITTCHTVMYLPTIIGYTLLALTF